MKVKVEFCEGRRTSGTEKFVERSMFEWWLRRWIWSASSTVVVAPSLDGCKDYGENKQNNDVHGPTNILNVGETHFHSLSVYPG